MSDSDDEYWGAETPQDETWWKAASNDGACLALQVLRVGDGAEL